MTTLLDFLPRARGLGSLSSEVEGLIADLLEHILRVEGPPVAPIPEVSEDYREAVARSLKGRPLCFARTWLTGPWRCLLLESRSVAMGRAIPLKPKEGAAGGYKVLDSRSWSFQRRVIAACHGLGIAAPIGEGSVHTVFGEHRSFLAWRHREADEPMNRRMQGDVDNFAKNVLDGLQKAGVLPNDKGVRRLSAEKDLPAAWEEPPLPLEEILRREAVARRQSGESFESIQVEMRLSKAHLSRIFPEYRPPKGARPTPSPAAMAHAAKEAVTLILQGTPYKDARKITGAFGAPLHEALALALRDRVLAGETTPQDLARELHLDPRSVTRIFQGDPEARQALQKASKAALRGEGRPTKAEAQQRLLKAVQAVQGGLSAAEASRTYGVNLGSLYSRLARLKAKAGRKTPRKGSDRNRRPKASPTASRKTRA